MSRLFAPLTLRGLTLPNRIVVSPMCQYSAVDGLPNDWHFVHLGQFALGRAGLLMTEATGVTPEGRISPADTGIWSDAHVDAWRRIVDFVHGQGRPIGMQLAHAGRKASTARPWETRRTVPSAEGGWPALGVTDAPFGGYAAPRPMTVAELQQASQDFAVAAGRALAAGFDAVELHFAHGYLGHQSYSPLVNTRSDGYGGDLAGRLRWVQETTEAVRAAWPQDRPLLARIAGSDWVPGGWTPQDATVLARELADRGVDLVDVSSGGAVPDAQIEVGPGYQVPFARAVREGSGVPTGAVGMITEPAQAEEILASGAADVVLLARELLRDPHWALRAAAALGADIDWPNQYERARWRGPVAAGPH